MADVPAGAALVAAAAIEQSLAGRGLSGFAASADVLANAPEKSTAMNPNLSIDTIAVLMFSSVGRISRRRHAPSNAAGAAR